jgi:hypothetical protein
MFPEARSDADPAQWARYVEHLRALGVEQRWLLLGRLVADARALARAGLRARHPDADAREIEIRLAVLLYGRDAAACLGPVPADAVEPVGDLDLPHVPVS